MNNARTMGAPSDTGKPSTAAMAAAVERYGRFWSELRPDSTADLRALARPDLRFVDPFNEIVGVERVVALLDHLFAGATGVAFTIRHQAWHDDTAFYRWDFACRLKRPAMDLPLVGVSEVRFDREALVAEHVDHWDAGAQVYERLPILGAILRRVRRRLSAGV
jgi:steroid delta-isomerase